MPPFQLRRVRLVPTELRVTCEHINASMEDSIHLGLPSMNAVVALLHVRLQRCRKENKDSQAFCLRLRNAGDR